ncbi:splicing factor 3B subunit 2, putative [Babesia bigemina]|uniref:Splicing factor 3B subunit 2, putative n=1 Tax=Babesia bigemina TaxID=5866 RepID=A0A061DBB2_BABBI|nr:splicing factor 3B subunit 2, putative [Babesia bigemina]CDR97986.1 splicing factor 3B subunit 2, putative [Babesia bigemina]|eukprot:XP_012770172.1 splicing factor 3B subunit 2, putative [Babesia bigemina]
MGQDSANAGGQSTVLRELRKRSGSAAKNYLKKLKRKQKPVGEPELAEKQSRTARLRDVLRDHFGDLEALQKDAESVDVEYVVPTGVGGEFQEVFDRFAQLERISLDLEPTPEEPEAPVENEFDSSDEDEVDESRRTMGSKKKLKLMNRPTLAQLKQIADKPEVVEFWDTTAADPKFLVWLKAQRNSVPVPSHWSEKMRYMQTRRSYDKPAYKLPPYIEDTKIAEIRSALREKEANKTLKQKMREKVRPKSHRMDINYQILHDAFFKYATKPAMTRYGDVYYVGKEMELRMRHYRPGHMSDRLKKALGVGENAPPPWLINMQRFGPPPSYPNLKIPGVNAPLPEGASFGFHAGGWGQLPTDDSGNPIFGYIDSTYYEDGHINKELWGELPKDETDDDASEYSDSSDDEKAEEGTAVVAPSVETPIPVVSTGLDTPLDMRAPADPPRAVPRKAYTVLEPKATNRSANALFGSQITYSMPPVATPITPVTGKAGAATPLGGMVTPSLQADGAMSADGVMRQLKFYENKAKSVQEAAGQIVTEAAEPKRAKKKKEFKF